MATCKLLTRWLPALLSLGGALCGQTLTKTITYTRFNGPPDNLRQIVFSYDATLGTTSFAAPTTVTSLPGADGVLFAPDGDIIVGGQANAVHKVVEATGAFTSVTAGGVASFHVMLDPNGTTVWTAGIPGFLASVPLNPFSHATPHLLSGDDIVITHMAFVGNQAFYTASFASGLGNFGTIDLDTFTTTRLFQSVPWAHGMTFDCYTGDLMVFANSNVAQINPVSHAIVSQLDVSPMNLQLDQGTSDGDGHLFIASNTGHMLFLDLTISQVVGKPDFADAPFLDSFIDDIAPDCGLGAPPVCPLSQGYWKTHASAWPVTNLTLGCSNYTQAQCLALMNTPNGGRGADASLILVKQLIAAKLNVANNSNNWPIAAALILQADALLCMFGGPLPFGVAPSTAIGQQMVALGTSLDLYNTGMNSPGCHAENEVLQRK